MQRAVLGRKPAQEFMQPVHLNVAQRKASHPRDSFQLQPAASVERNCAALEQQHFAELLTMICNRRSSRNVKGDLELTRTSVSRISSLRSANMKARILERAGDSFRDGGKKKLIVVVEGSAARLVPRLQYADLSTLLHERNKQRVRNRRSGSVFGEGGISLKQPLVVGINDQYRLATPRPYLHDAALPRAPGVRR